MMYSGLCHLAVCIEADIAMVVSPLVGHEHRWTLIVEMASVLVRFDVPPKILTLEILKYYLVFRSLFRIFAAIKLCYMEFREMRRKRQQLSEEESIGILQKATSGTLALLSDGGYPYAVPISYVYHDGKLYFHSALTGHKVDAIRKCDKASFCVIEKDDVQPEKYTTFFRSVIAFGRIYIIEDEHEKLEVARMLGNRYNPNQDEALQKEIESGLSRMLVIRFDIDHLTGKEAIELVRQHQK